MNPYDLCMANMTTECGKQLRVICHVDDLMSSCENDLELTKLSCYLLGKIYGHKIYMHIRKKHDYLGVDKKFNDNGTLGLSMIT